jgi:pimeloyl-ACP methyl ester carboxylesterase
VIEYPCSFGPDRSLAGIISEPEGTEAATDRENIAVIMITAGLLHHVGPNRMWVELAARVTEMGLSAFRFDLAGLGDSLLYESNLTYEERSINDIVLAMNYLETNKRIEKFILIGFCSGAENAHNTALQDRRVVGAVFLDGYIYRTPMYYVRRSIRFLKNPAKWIGFLIRLAVRLQKRLFNQTAVHDSREDIVSSAPPSKEKIKREIEQLISQDFKMIFIFSGAANLYISDGKKFLDLFDLRDYQKKIDILHYRKADHMYTLLEYKQRLISDIIQWISTRFP